MGDTAYRPAGYCPHCGYALDPGRCPECGSTVAGDELDAAPYGRRGHKLGAVGTGFAIAAVLAPPVWFGLSSDGPFLYVLSGRLFRAGFDRIHAGTVMDQPTIGKWYAIFSVFSGVGFTYMAAVRWFSHRRMRAGYWAYVVPAACVRACLLIILTMPFYWLLQYIHEVGFTTPRVCGLAYGLAGYVAIGGFLCWAARRPARRRASVPPNGVARGVLRDWLGNASWPAKNTRYSSPAEPRVPGCADRPGR